MNSDLWDLWDGRDLWDIPCPTLYVAHAKIDIDSIGFIKQGRYLIMNQGKDWRKLVEKQSGKMPNGGKGRKTNSGKRRKGNGLKVATLETKSYQKMTMRVSKGDEADLCEL